MIHMSTINRNTDDDEDGHRLYPDERRVLAIRLESLDDSNRRVSHDTAMTELTEFKTDLKD
jgi:hypothetical protein